MNSVTEISTDFSELSWYNNPGREVNTMTIIQKLQARNIIARVAHRQGISTAQCRAEMAAAITEAWRTTDPAIRQHQIQLVGEERIPTPEEFILLISREL